MDGKEYWGNKCTVTNMLVLNDREVYRIEKPQWPKQEKIKLKMLDKERER